MATTQFWPTLFYLFFCSLFHPILVLFLTAEECYSLWSMVRPFDPKPLHVSAQWWNLYPLAHLQRPFLPGDTLPESGFKSASPLHPFTSLFRKQLFFTSHFHRIPGSTGERESCQHRYIRNTIQAAAVCVLFLDYFIFSLQTDLNFYNIIISPRSNNICCLKSKVNSFGLSRLHLSIGILL